MNKNIIETIVGALVLIVAAYFMYYAYSTTQTIASSANSYVLFGKFSRADGVNLGSDVRIAGIKVGKVTAQTLDPKTFQAILELSIRSDITLPTDTSAEIIGNGLLGEKYISLVPGADEEMLGNKAFLEFTQSSISLESLIGKFMFSGDNKGDEKNKKKSGSNANQRS